MLYYHINRSDTG